MKRWIQITNKYCKKQKKSSIAIHKKINRLILVNVVFIIACGLLVFSVNNKDSKHNNVENQGQEDILTDRNNLEPEKELFDSTEKALNDSMNTYNTQSTIQENEINSEETDSINSKQ